MTLVTLPEPIAAYFAAEHQPERLARCFMPQAILKDDGAVPDTTTQCSARW